MAKSFINSGLGSNSCFGKTTGKPDAAASRTGIENPPYFIGSAKMSAEASFSQISLYPEF